MKRMMIISLLPLICGADTQTPGRPGLQILAIPHGESDILDNPRRVSRNVWASYKDAKLNIAGDSIYNSLISKFNLPADYDFSKVTKGADGTPQTPEAFKSAIGLQLAASAVTKTVHPYEVPNAKKGTDATRYQYTALVFESENEFTVFAAQGHPILTDPNDLLAVQQMAGKTAQTNFEAKAKRNAESGKPSNVKLVTIKHLTPEEKHVLAESFNFAAVS